MGAPDATATGLLLALDTSTSASLVAIGRRIEGTDRCPPEAVSRRRAKHRHGAHLLDQVAEVLDAVGVGLEAVSALAVGTGPGSFTGLRVGLAAAKTLGYARRLPLVGVRSSDALRRAAVDGAGAASGVVVVLPAGAHDHYLVRDGEDATLVPPGALAGLLGDGPVLSVDLEEELLGAEASRLGEAALDGLPAALLALASARLAAGQLDPPDELVPTYVALPRGVGHGAEELGWSPDLR